MYKILDKSIIGADEMVMNMGPQHPSTHGVLRLKIVTDGEIVSHIEPIIGYLHRCFEKHCENLSYEQIVPFTDRCDYLAAMHMAHGYLLHQFFSPLSNFRKDNYGGNLRNRCRFLIEVAKSVRNIWPKKRILGARITGKDWINGGLGINDSVYLSKQLKKIGFDYVCVSSGGLISNTKNRPKFNFNYKILSHCVHSASQNF